MAWIALAAAAAGLVCTPAVADPLDDGGDTLDKDGETDVWANISFVLAADETPEGAGVAAIDVKVSNNSSFVGPVEVTHNVTDGTAAPDAYEGANGTVSFDEPGQVRTVNLSLVDDGLHEGDATVVLTLSSDDDLVSFGTRNHTHTILEDDPANLGPHAPDLAIEVEAGTSTSGTLPGSDPDGDPLTWSVADPPSHGSVSVDSTRAYTYSPEAGYTGPDVFRYQVTDGGASDTGRVDVKVEPAGSTDDSSSDGQDRDDGFGDGTHPGEADGTGDGSAGETGDDADGTSTTDETDGGSGTGASPGDGAAGEDNVTSAESGDIGAAIGWWIAASVVGVVALGGAIAYGLLYSHRARF
jgi:hypothetical protein